MRSLFASTCLTPIALGLIASSASAATVTIGAAQTTPVATSTANAGASADISITSAGAINPTSGTAVTIDSNNSVTNAGGITIKEVNGATGILANAGVTGSITNSGTITVSEAYTPIDTNGDTVPDGPFAQGSNRIGIHTAGAFTGTVNNSGTILVQGNDSAGIALDGPLTGDLQQTGTITVAGDRSVGIRAGAISGSAAINGTIGVKGANASGVVLNGDIGSALVVQAVISSTGYSSIGLPTDTTKLTAGNLLQGGPAMQIGGNVAGGALFTAATSTKDASGNTITTTAATLTSFGSAPALLVGSSSQAITLGAVASDADKHGLVINGSVSGNGVYDGMIANGLVIGGLGGSVSIANGMTIGGAVSATANDATATAIRIGSGATVPAVIVSGTISASGGSKATDTNTAFQIDSGAGVSSLTNSGSIKATAGTVSSATAILDKSGTLALVTNSGAVSASGGASNVAIDLSAATAAAQVNQLAPASGTVAPSIVGDVKFGSGSDQFTIAAGSVAGNTSFGAGANTLALSNVATYTGNVSFGAGNDAMTLGDTSSFTGAADFSGGSDRLTLRGTARFNGTLANSAGLAVTVSGGSLNLTSTGPTALASLAVSGGGTLGVTVDANGNATRYAVSGAASFDTGSKLALHFTDFAHTAGTYTVVTASSVSGVNNIATTGTTLPWLFKSSVAASSDGNGVDVTVARKTADELGLNRSGSAAYEAIYAAISADKPVGGAFLSITDGSTFTNNLRELLPDHAGGAFDTVSSASRATARILADPDAPLADEGNWGFWIQQVGWGRTKAIGDTSGYHITGWGVSGGAEIQIGDIGRFGLSAAYLAGQDSDSATSNEVNANQYELGAYWRSDWGPLHAFARGSIGTVDFKSHRRFDGMNGTTQVLRTSIGAWNGKLYSGAAGLSYKLQLGAFSLRPQASIDYYHLKEGHYAEAGSDAAINLIVNGRTSDEFAANGALALGYSFFDQSDEEGGFLRAELEGGRRQLIGGSLGSTTAHFTGGQSFTLTPEDRTNGWTGALRLKGGTSAYAITGEFSGEQQQSHVAVALRAGLQVGF